MNIACKELPSAIIYYLDPAPPNTNFWHVHYHRDDGPAIEWFDGTKEWYQNGLRHRIDGPAVESIHTNRWFQHGKLHRLDGPAVEYNKTDIYNQYYLDGIEYSEQEHSRLVKLKAFW